MSNVETTNKGTLKKLVLIIEDDLGVGDELRKMFDKYQSDLEIQLSQNAGEAMLWLDIDAGYRRPQALLLDLMMPYGEARQKLDKDFEDFDETETGLRLLEFLRREEKKAGLDPVWVSIITARSPLVIGKEAKALLDNHGKAYYKPLNTLWLEDDLMRALGIPSKVPAALRPAIPRDEDED